MGVGVCTCRDRCHGYVCTVATVVLAGLYTASGMFHSLSIKKKKGSALFLSFSSFPFSLFSLSQFSSSAKQNVHLIQPANPSSSLPQLVCLVCLYKNKVI